MLLDWISISDIFFLNKNYWIFFTPKKCLYNDYFLIIQFFFEFINNIQIFFKFKYLQLKYLQLKYFILKLKLKINLYLEYFFNRYLINYFNNYFFDYLIDIIFSKNIFNKFFKIFFFKNGVTKHMVKLTLKLGYLNLLKLYKNSYYFNFLSLKIYLNKSSYLSNNNNKITKIYIKKI